MNIPEHFIRRPVMTTLITAAVTLFGWMAYQKLPVSELPNVDFPTISISASLPGASPETMAASVATPLEQQLSSIAGIDSMTSTSSLGSTSITLQFNLDRDIDGAAQRNGRCTERMQAGADHRTALHVHGAANTEIRAADHARGRGPAARHGRTALTGRGVNDGIPDAPANF